MKFHLGLGKFYTKLDKEHRNVMRMSVEAGFGIHYCLDYPGSSKFFKSMTSKQERAEIETITRVPCFDTEILKSEVDLTLKSLDIDQIGTLQLWGGVEIMDCYNTNSNLYETLMSLKENGKINSFVPQVYYDQSSLLLEKSINTASIAFYGSPLGIHLSKELISKNILTDSIAMSIFGGIDLGNNPVLLTEEEKNFWYNLTSKYSWTDISLLTLESFGFIQRVVGATGSTKHMSEIINYFNNTTFTDFDINSEMLKKIAIQSCSKNHMAPSDAKERWINNHDRLRSTEVFVKSLAYHYIKKNKTIQNSIDTLFNRRK